MDTSEIYKKMCHGAERAAPELFYKSTYEAYDYAFKVEGNDKFWWLPRQDQLQELLGGQIKEQEQLFHEAYISGFLKGSTWEQLWLALVMLKLKNRVWDGVRWLK